MYTHPGAEARPYWRGPWQAVPENASGGVHRSLPPVVHAVPSSSPQYRPGSHNAVFQAPLANAMRQPLPHEILGSSIASGHEQPCAPDPAPKKRKYAEDTRSEGEIEALARRLYSKLLAIPKYKSYRDKIPQKVMNDVNVVWPDNVEFTMIRAIARFTPCWRERKPNLGEDDGANGRNQLIKNIIKLVTGADRKRKQVSSHLQVIKGHVGKDHFLIPYLVSSQASSTKDGREQGNLSDLEDKFTAEERDELRCIAFDMTAWRSGSSSAASDLQQPLHIFTHAFGRTHQDAFAFADVQHCLEHYPELMMADITRFVDVPIVCADASLSPAGQAVFSPQNGLHIKFFLSGPRIPGMTRTRTKTLLFENSIPTMQFTKDGCMEFTKIDDKEICRYQVPFFSKQWIARLARWGRANDEVQALAKEPPTRGESKDARAARIESLRQQVAQQINSLTAVQQIFVGNDLDPTMQLLMIVHWTFSQAPDDQTGRTYWRRLEFQKPPLQRMHAPISIADALKAFDDAAPDAQWLARVRQYGREFEARVESERRDGAPRGREYAAPTTPIFIEPIGEDLWFDQRTAQRAFDHSPGASMDYGPLLPDPAPGLNSYEQPPISFHTYTGMPDVAQLQEPEALRQRAARGWRVETIKDESTLPEDAVKRSESTISPSASPLSPLATSRTPPTASPAHARDWEVLRPISQAGSSRSIKQEEL